MCAACGVPTHVAVLDAAQSRQQQQAAGGRAGQPSSRRCATPTCRVYLGGAALAMMADNIEHVITYWVVWERFHSPALTGFEVHQPLAAVPAAVALLRRPRRPLRLPQAHPGVAGAVHGRVAHLGHPVRHRDAHRLERLRPADPARHGRGAVGTARAAHARGLRRPRRPAERHQAQLHRALPRRAVRPGGRLRAAARPRPRARHLGQHRLLPAADHPDGAHQVHRPHPRRHRRARAGHRCSRPSGCSATCHATGCSPS